MKKVFKVKLSIIPSKNLWGKIDFFGQIAQMANKNFGRNFGKTSILAHKTKKG